MPPRTPRWLPGAVVNVLGPTDTPFQTDLVNTLGIAVSAGDVLILYCDGTDVIELAVWSPRSTTSVMW
jgi:hypothetical protein